MVQFLCCTTNKSCFTLCFRRPEFLGTSFSTWPRLQRTQYRAKCVSSTCQMQSNVVIGELPLVKRFMRGVFNMRPSLPRYNVIWDVSPVLNYLSSLVPNEEITILKLASKLATLIALLSAQRGQSLHLLDIRNMTLTDDKVSFRIGDLIKQSRPGKHISELTFPAYVADVGLCVVQTVKSYITRTDQQRAKCNTSRLFISTIAPHQPVSRDTISRWVMLALRAAASRG